MTSPFHSVFFFVALFFCSSFTSLLHATPVIDQNDTIVFDLSAMNCVDSGRYLPVYIISDDQVWALDFTLTFNHTELSYNSITDIKSYIFGTASYNLSDSLLRYSSFGIQPYEHQSPLLKIKFIQLAGFFRNNDLSITRVLLNGQECSFKVINSRPPASIIDSAGISSIAFGDTVVLSTDSFRNDSYLWSTGELSRSIDVTMAGIYSITVSNQGCSSEDAITLIPSSPLPVDLYSFEARQTDEGVLLEWSTLSETDNDYFTIEKAFESHDWKFLTEIKAFGNSNLVKSYSTIDTNPAKGLNLYRLSQTDFNGNMKHLKIISLNFLSHMSNNYLSVYPNPAGQDDLIDINIQGILEELVLQIINSAGQIVFKKELNIPESDSEYDMSFSANILSPDTYHLSVSGSGKLQNCKLIIR